jgi:hypothetical protein
LLRNHFEAEGNTISVLSNRKNNRPVLTFVYTKKDDYKPTGKVEFVFSENRRILIKEDMYSSKIHVPETKVCCLAEINYDLITTTIINFLTRIEENKTKNL